MSGTIYSYKPADGSLAGASTAVTLKTGQLLELRREEKTRWRRGEERQRWATVEEWRASLPAGAEVKESGAMYPAAVAASADFRAILAIAWKQRVYIHNHIVSISNNATDAARIMRGARLWEKDSARYAKFAPHWGSRLSRALTIAASKRAHAETILARPAYNRHVCRNKRLSWKLQVQREDGVFVPLLVDKTRNLLHIPVMDELTYRGVPVLERVGATVAELGVRPVFLLQTGLGTRMMTLEEVHAMAAAE